MKKKRLPLIIAAVALALFMVLGSCSYIPPPAYSSSPVTDTDDGYYSEERGE
jgi:hypothetical protein